MMSGCSSRMWLGFGRVTRHPNLCRSANLACVALQVAIHPAQFGWLLFACSVGERFHNNVLSEPHLRHLSRRFAESALLLIHVAASNLASLKNAKDQTIGSQTKFCPLSP
jgi:hypothetical protein